MNKYTPGPWKAISSIVCREIKMMEIAEVSHMRVVPAAGGWPEPCGTPEDDARLIAAAPDQHEANKVSLMILSALRNANDWHPNVLKDIDFAIEANRAAIAKATQ